MCLNGLKEGGQITGECTAVITYPENKELNHNFCK